LIIAALRTSISSGRIAGPQRLMISTGVGLALLGLLDIGPKAIDVMQEDYLAKTNRMYRLLGSRWPLVVVMGVYFVVYFGGLVGSRFLKKRKNRVCQVANRIPY
jgi:hypothetical protein